MIAELVVFVLTVIIAYFFYAYKRIHYRFENNGIKYKPGIPVFGNMFKSTFLKRHMMYDIGEVYDAFPDERYVGFIESTTPIILIKDPDLIKNITVKDFDHFVDHKDFFPEEVDKLWGGSVFMMKGNRLGGRCANPYIIAATINLDDDEVDQAVVLLMLNHMYRAGDKWRDMRTTLSPAFTGSKMRHMMPFMQDISNNIIEYLKGIGDEEIDVGDLVRRYTNDVIASAAFGLQVNSIKDRNNDFYVRGQGLFKFTLWQRIKFMVLVLYPALAKKIQIQVMPPETTGFFRNVVTSTMEFRKKNNVDRPDMIQLLMEASKGTLRHSSSTTEKDDVGFATVKEALKPQGNIRQWTQDELAAQVFLFFVAGFESSATGVVMAIHELAINSDVQEKLYQEIKEFHEKRGNLTYDHVNELKYLDCVLNETLRKWSAAIILDRVCVKAYELPPPREGGKPYLIKPGDIVYNPVNNIHMDPQYFPDPEKFDPERFSDENKHQIKPFTFMPFGSGPRNCIGSRFALLELKVLLFDLILNFKIVKSPRTQDPIELDPTDFNIKASRGTFVKLEARN